MDWVAQAIKWEKPHWHKYRTIGNNTLDSALQLEISCDVSIIV